MSAFVLCMKTEMYSSSGTIKQLMWGKNQNKTEKNDLSIEHDVTSNLAQQTLSGLLK